MHPDVARLVAFVADHENVAERFAPGAPPEQIDRLAGLVVGRIPEALVDLYSWADGTRRIAFQPEFRDEARWFETRDDRLLSVDGVLSAKKQWDEQALAFSKLSAAEREHHWSWGFWHTDWIPLCDSEASLVALAVTPCFAGPEGQIISFDFKGGTQWTIEHSSVGDWLRTAVEVLTAEAGERVDEGEGFDRGDAVELRVRLNPKSGWVEIPMGSADPSRFHLPVQLFARPEEGT
jgi:cell wall assembly regulator SMI1